MSKPDSGQPTATNSKREAKPIKVLPTNRVAASKQFEIIRAFGAHGGTDRQSVPNIDVSKTVSLHHSTVGLVTPFLADIGLVVKGVPAEEVSEFSGAYEWNPTSAFHRLAPLLRKTWFFAKLEPKLRFKPLTRSEAIQELSIACAAGPTYRPQLEMILQYLNEAGLIVMDGENLRLSRTNGAANANGSNGAAHEDNGEEPEAVSEPPQRSAVATSFSREAGAGVVRFNISVSVDTTEFANWEPSRISAFFAGVAQVLAAKGNVEEKTART